jgi:Tfp pilus assembly protein PilF
LVNLGNLSLEAGNLDAAQDWYERALRIDATYALAHHNLGVVYRKRGNLAASIRELRLAARYEGLSHAARRRLAWWKRR